MRDAIVAWWRSETPATRGAFVAILVLGTALRIVYLVQPMRYDEAVTYLYFVGRPWHTAISAYQFPNNHLLHTVLAKLTSPLAGGRPWAIRLPAFAAGVAIIPLTYAVGLALFTPVAGLIGSALVATSTTLALYATNARGYSLLVAAYLVLLLIAVRVRAGNGTPRTWVAFGLVSAAGLATIPVMLYPIGAVAAWLVLTIAVEDRRRARVTLLWLGAALVMAAGLAALAYLPIIHANGLASLTSNKFVLASPWPQFFRELLPSLWKALESWSEPFPMAVMPLLAGALIVGALQSTRVSREGVSVMSAALIWSALGLLANHHAPFPRTWLWLVPIAALVVGAGIEVLLRRVAPVRTQAMAPVLATGVVAFGLVWGLRTDAVGLSLDTGLFRGAEAVAQSLSTNAQPGDRVLAPIPSNAPLQFYLLRYHADTAMLSTPAAATQRSIIVLNRAYGQTVDWAVAAEVIDTAHFGPIAPAMHAPDADVYVAERKARGP